MARGVLDGLTFLWGRESSTCIIANVITLATLRNIGE